MATGVLFGLAASSRKWRCWNCSRAFQKCSGWIRVEGLQVVLHDLPLLLVGLGTKPSLQAEPKSCVCQELLGFARNDSTCATHPWEGKGWESLTGGTWIVHQGLVWWDKRRWLQDGPVVTAFPALFPPHPEICAPCASWAPANPGLELLVLLVKLRSCQLATSAWIFPNFGASVQEFHRCQSSMGLSRCVRNVFPQCPSLRV